MDMIWKSAFGLLIITGSLLGLSLPFGKIATAAGVEPVVWAFVISAGGGGAIMLGMLLRGHGFHFTRHKLRYFLVTAIITYAIPNLLLFSVMPHVGAGYAGIMYTLSPIMTLVFSILSGVRRPNSLGIAGIAIGFLGAIMVATTRGQLGAPASLFWVTVALLIPVSLAAGNIYRTADWPEGTAPTELAVGSNLAAALVLLAGVLVSSGGAAFSPLAAMPLLVLAQIAASAAMFVFFFRLQVVGGPVYLSQIGYVAAAVGLLSGTLFLGERYGLLTWLGAAVICIGVMVTTKAQARTE
ncbi:DMT family transporter [Mesorhizobium sp. VNQ89]|uniref:DMT family transporter n=1 Tax=Mesorhizobium quangtriensis TaxID=3157709 RepID=UPI0032B7C0FA